jgi:hypothetical protein
VDFLVTQTHTNNSANESQQEIIVFKALGVQRNGKKAVKKPSNSEQENCKTERN